MLRLGDIGEIEFKTKYRHELQSPIVQELLRHMRSEADNKIVYIVKDPKFERYILLDLMP